MLSSSQLFCICSVVANFFATLWTAAHHVPLSMRLPRQEYLSGLPFPPPGDLPDPGIEPTSPALAGRFFTTEPPGKPCKRWNSGVKVAERCSSFVIKKRLSTRGQPC